jgi:hypothetical protein
MSLCENDNLTNNELNNIVNLLQKKVSDLEKKINKLETEIQYNSNNSNNFNYNDEVLLEEKIFRSICIEPPEISRQHAFNLSVSI